MSAIEKTDLINSKIAVDPNSPKSFLLPIAMEFAAEHSSSTSISSHNVTNQISTEEGQIPASSSSSSSIPSPMLTASSNRYDEDEDEGDVCRICRNPGDSDNPLRYPCACSGSIKFVHQDCLLQWLNHSNARNCEVCFFFSIFPPRHLSLSFLTTLEVEVLGV